MIPLWKETIVASYKVKLWDGRTILGKFYLHLCYKIGWIKNRPCPTQNERRLVEYAKRLDTPCIKSTSLEVKDVRH